MVREGDRERPSLLVRVRPPRRRHAWAGHDNEEKEAAAQLREVYPGFTVTCVGGEHRSKDLTYKAERQRIAEGLRKAGVPEGKAKSN